MKRKILILSLTLIFILLLGSLCIAQQEAKEEKKGKLSEQEINGTIFAHPENNDIKLMTDDYQIFTFQLNKESVIEVTIKGTLEDMANEIEARIPKGRVTYTIIDGKPVVTKIKYSSGEKWNMEPPQPREE